MAAQTRRKRGYGAAGESAWRPKERGPRSERPLRAPARRRTAVARDCVAGDRELPERTLVCRGKTANERGGRKRAARWRRGARASSKGARAVRRGGRERGVGGGRGGTRRRRGNATSEHREAGERRFGRSDASWAVCVGPVRVLGGAVCLQICNDGNRLAASGREAFDGEAVKIEQACEPGWLVNLCAGFLCTLRGACAVILRAHRLYFREQSKRVTSRCDRAGGGGIVSVCIEEGRKRQRRSGAWRGGSERKRRPTAAALLIRCGPEGSDLPRHACKAAERTANGERGRRVEERTQGCTRAKRSQKREKRPQIVSRRKNPRLRPGEKGPRSLGFAATL